MNAGAYSSGLRHAIRRAGLYAPPRSWGAIVISRPMSTRTAFTPLQTSDFTAAFPSSRKVYVQGPAVSVPMREISLSNGETIRLYDTSGLARDVFVSGSLAYIADGDPDYSSNVGSGLQIIDVSNPVSPVRLGGHSAYSPRGVAVAGFVSVISHL